MGPLQPPPSCGLCHMQGEASTAPFRTWGPRSLTWDSGERLRMSGVAGVLKGQGSVSHERAVGGGPTHEKEGHAVPWGYHVFRAGEGLLLGSLG